MPLIGTTEVKIILEEIQSGNKPLKVFCQDGNIYYIKGKKLLRPIDYAVVREFLCSAFLRIWGIQTPLVKGVTMDPNIVRASMPSLYPAWLDYQNHVCFGSKRVEGFEISQIFDLNQFRGLKRYGDPFDFLRIALFDLWVCNEDRNIRHSNLLLSKSDRGREFCAFDHELSFASDPFEDLKTSSQLTYEESLLGCDFVKKILKTYPEKLPDFHAYFEQCVNNCRSSHANILNSIESCLNLTVPGKLELEQFLYDSSRLNLIFDNFQHYLLW